MFSTTLKYLCRPLKHRKNFCLQKNGVPKQAVIHTELVVSCVGINVQAIHAFKLKCTHSQNRPTSCPWRQPVEQLRVLLVSRFCDDADGTTGKDFVTRIVRSGMCRHDLPSHNQRLVPAIFRLVLGEISVPRSSILFRWASGTSSNFLSHSNPAGG